MWRACLAVALLLLLLSASSLLHLLSISYCAGFLTCAVVTLPMLFRSWRRRKAPAAPNCQG